MSAIDKRAEPNVPDWMVPQSSMVRLKDLRQKEDKTRTAAIAAARRIIAAVNVERKSKLKA
jgi:hypothetical protein